MREELISAAEASRRLYKLLRALRERRTYMVMIERKPVRRIASIVKNENVASAAHRALLDRLEARPLVEGERWSRDELYERGTAT